MIKDSFIEDFNRTVAKVLTSLPKKEIAKVASILLGAYEKGKHIYIIGNGGSLAMATHWVADLNKTVFSRHLHTPFKRFKAVRIPSTEAELTAWANDINYDMVFAGPLSNYLEEGDILIAISSSGNSPNIIKAVELAKKRGNTVIGISGFDGGKLHKLADAKILAKTRKGEYEIVESVHMTVLHLITKFFKGHFAKKS
jgi:D-sedoheptulose 7-phosphate isomerase